MKQTFLHNVRALRPGVGIVASSLLLMGDRIAAFDTAGLDTAEAVDGGGRLLTPGLIDIHTHGIHRFLYEASPEAIVEGTALLPRYGVTCVFPTLYRVLDRSSLPRLRALAAALSRVRNVRAPGFHLEGPFLALPGAGAETIAGDTALLADLLTAMEGRVRAVSISPDTPRIEPVIRELVSRGICTLITHTCASVAETEAAIEAGASHATHFYDVFPVPKEVEPGARPVGAVEAILADDRVSVDFIADGVHVHPTAIKAALKAKGPRRVLLITDSNIGAGLPAGVHETPWGFPVRVAPGDAARIDSPGSPLHSCLAGSALTMDVGMSNLLRWLDLPEHDIWSMGTRSVAERMGLSGLGDLTAGAAADLVLWDREDDGRLRAVKTWVGGKLVYDSARHPQEALS